MQATMMMHSIAHFIAFPEFEFLVCENLAKKVESLNCMEVRQRLFGRTKQGVIHGADAPNH